VNSSEALSQHFNTKNVQNGAVLEIKPPPIFLLQNAVAVYEFHFWRNCRVTRKSSITQFAM
jgi:hypothetical protein